jgi:serine/threonine-protein kinase
VDALFTRALELEPEERPAFLAEACGGDRELREAVEELLATEAEAERARFLDRAAAVTWKPIWEEAAHEGRGPEARASTDRAAERLGPWRLAEEIGRGGMATVYRARRVDGAFEQEVAVKVVRPSLAAHRLVRRLEAEREILAGLDHPNIARILDGGTTEDGLPYLVMELVEGRPITACCEEEGLGPGERLELFGEVLEAVAHAHRRLVLHRDLKPSNILVTDDGRVRLLDFGIAKLLDEEGADEGPTLTRHRAGPLTPDYASPEQIRGEPVTTASDVYQLGVLLYRLLAGRRPYRVPADSPTAMLRALEEREVDPPSETAASEGAGDGGEGAVEPRRLKGDLDTIVMKALREEPEKRYASVEALAEDLDRHRDDRPITARAPRWRYRLRKFVGRNPWPVAAGVAGLLAAAGYGWTLHRHAAELERERNVARAEAAKAEQVQGFLVDLFRRPDPFASDETFRGAELTVREALDLGLERAREELIFQPEVQASLLGTVGDVYANLELEERALEVEWTALEVSRQTWGEGSPRTLDALDDVATRLWQLGELPAAESLYRREYLPLATEARGPGSVQVARGLMGLGNVLSARSELEAAETALDSAALLYRAAGAGHRKARAELLHNLSNLQHRLGRFSAAEQAARGAVSIREQLDGPDHPHTAVALTALGSALAGQGRYEEALEVERRALGIFEKRLGRTHRYTLSTLNNLAVNAARAGRHEAAASDHARLAELWREKEGDRSLNVANSLQNLAAALSRAGRRGEAARQARAAHRLYRELVGPDHFRTALPLLTLSEIHLLNRDWSAAERAAREATAILERSLPEGHYVTAVARGRVGRTLAGQGRSDEAAVLLRRSLETLRAAPADTRRYVGEMERALEELDRGG